MRGYRPVDERPRPPEPRPRGAWKSRHGTSGDPVGFDWVLLARIALNADRPAPREEREAPDRASTHEGNSGAAWSRPLPNGCGIQLPRADPQRERRLLRRQDTTTWEKACGVSWKALLGSGAPPGVQGDLALEETRARGEIRDGSAAARLPPCGREAPAVRTKALRSLGR